MSEAMRVLKSRLISNKSMFTKSLTNCSEDLNKFRDAQVKEASENRLRRLAGVALDSLENAGAKLNGSADWGRVDRGNKLMYHYQG